MRRNPLNFPLIRRDPLNFRLECPVCTEPFRDQRDVVKCHACQQNWCVVCNTSLTECPYCRTSILGREQQAIQAAQQRRLSWINFMNNDFLEFDPISVSSMPDESVYSFDTDVYSLSNEPMSDPNVWRPIVYGIPDSPIDEEY